jgi:hypothetical protein
MLLTLNCNNTNGFEKHYYIKSIYSPKHNQRRCISYYLKHNIITTYIKIGCWGYQKFTYWFVGVESTDRAGDFPFYLNRDRWLKSGPTHLI